MHPAAEDDAAAAPQRKPGVIAEVRRTLRRLGYSRRTEQAYLGWIRRFLRANGSAHPSALGTADVARFLDRLLLGRGVAAGTQKQARAALRFLYRHVFVVDASWARLAPARKLPVHGTAALTPSEAVSVIARVDRRFRPLVRLVCATGMAIADAVRLRTTDIDLARREITLRGRRTAANRTVPLPKRLLATLQRQLDLALTTRLRDSEAGANGIWLRRSGPCGRPMPRAGSAWQYLFHSDAVSFDSRGTIRRREHVDIESVQRAVRLAARAAGVAQPVDCDVLRDSMAAHLARRADNLRAVRELLGRYDLAVGPPPDTDRPADASSRAGNTAREKAGAAAAATACG